MGRFIDRIRERRANRRFNRSFNEAMENAYGDNYYMTPDVRGYHENAFRNGPEAFNEAVETVKFRNAHPRTASQSRFVEDNDLNNIKYVMLEKAKQSLSAIDPSSMKPLQRQRTDMDEWQDRAAALSGGKFKTIADVVEFQKRMGLKADGKFGDSTRNAFMYITNKPKVETDKLMNDIGNYEKFEERFIPTNGLFRFASGGSMNNKEFIKYLAECTGAKDSQSLKKAMEALGEKGVNALKEMFNKGVPASEVKKKISGQSQYMKKGGCLSCEGKMARFAKASKPELNRIMSHANVNTISTLRCGGKAKKKMIKKSK